MPPHTTASGVRFRSSFFKVQPGEDEETNPGIFGKQLVEWLIDKLQAHGVQVDPEYGAEDWGFIAFVRGHPFPLWIGCRNSEDRLDSDWTVFIEAEPSIFQRLFRRVDTKPAVHALKVHLEHIVGEIPDVGQVIWS